VFGIPRALQGTEGPKGNGEPSQLINTNLEQISDWLTKIIVGVSLVQAQQIFANLVKASERLGRGLVGFDSDLATGIVTVTIVAGLVVGFLAMYIETRTFLSTMFLRIAKIERRLSQTDLNVIKDAPAVSTGPKKAELSTDQQAAVNRVAAQPLSSAKTPEEQASWAKANFWQGNYVAAADGYAHALTTRPDDYEMRREYGRALTMAGKPDLAVAEFDKARELAARTKDVNAVRELNIDRVWVQLYRPIDGFEEAIALGKKLMAEDPALTADPRLQTYMACAYGQKYRLHSIQENAELADDAAEEAKGAINRVIAATAANTSWRQFLRVLASGQSADDDDLAFLAKERPDVRKLIDDATNS
jgi:tetratricopeptide (TPR) repeat protein